MFDEPINNPRRSVSIGKLKMTLTRDQIMTFVNGLHETQWELIESTVVSAEKKGFPEATEVINYIRSL